MKTPITLINLETKIYQLLDNDITLFEDDCKTYKMVLQYNSISKIFVVIKYDLIIKKNEVLCITKKPTIAINLYNLALESNE